MIFGVISLELTHPSRTTALESPPGVEQNVASVFLEPTEVVATRAPAAVPPSPTVPPTPTSVPPTPTTAPPTSTPTTRPSATPGAALAIVDAIGGSEDNFAGMMNAEAAKLALKDSHFVDAHGLDRPDHYSSAYDLAMAARYGLTYFPEFGSLAKARAWDVQGSRS